MPSFPKILEVMPRIAANVEGALLNQWSVEDGTHGPTDHAPAVEIEDRDQIEPALSGEHAGGIAHPDLITALHTQALDTVGRDGSAVAAVSDGSSILGALSSEDPLQAHKASNAIAPSRTAQRMSQARAAVSPATASKFLSDALAQADVLQWREPGK